MFKWKQTHVEKQIIIFVKEESRIKDVNVLKKQKKM